VAELADAQDLKSCGK